jgi:CBS domain-containing protein
MIVREAMSPEVETVRPSQSVEEIAQLMAKKGIGYFPVCNRGLLVGVITDRDITCRVVADRRRPQATKVADVMSKEVASCFDDDNLTTAIHLMEQYRIRRIPVVDRDERLVGVLSLTDIARQAPHRVTAEILEAVSREAPLSVTIRSAARHSG